MVANGDDFTARLMNDMDPALLDFVKVKVNSFIKWDLVRFFYENPNTLLPSNQSWKTWWRVG